MYRLEHYVFEPAMEYPADYMAPKGHDFETETQLLSHGSFLTSVGLAYQAFSNHLFSSCQDQSGVLAEVDVLRSHLQNLFLELLPSLTRVTPDQMVRSMYELTYNDQVHELGMRLSIGALGRYGLTFYHEACGQDYNEDYVLEQTQEWRVRWNQCTL